MLCCEHVQDITERTGEVWCRRCFSSMTRFLPDCWRPWTQPGISCQPRMTPGTAWGKLFFKDHRAYHFSSTDTVFSISKWMFLLTNTRKRAHRYTKFKVSPRWLRVCYWADLYFKVFLKWHLFHLWLSVFGLLIYERLLFIDCLVNEKCHPNKVRLIGWMNISETLLILLQVSFLRCASRTVFMACATHRNPLTSSFFFLLKCYRGVYIGYFGFLSFWAVLLSQYFPTTGGSSCRCDWFYFCRSVVHCSHQHVQVVEEEVHPSTRDFGTHTSSAMLTEGHAHTINSNIANMTQILCSDSHTDFLEHTESYMYM